MDWQFATVLDERKSQVILLEARAGQARRALIQAWLQEAQQKSMTTWLLSCDHEEGGPWTGLNELVAAMLPDLEAHAPELITKHDYELAVVMPTIQRTLKVGNPSLTELSPETERTRNYAADRAFRIVHGLIDLFTAWCELTASRPSVITCDSFDRAGALTRLFFGQLMRRRGERLQLTLIVSMEPDQAASATNHIAASSITHKLQLDLPPDPPVEIDQQALKAQIKELSERSRIDLFEREIVMPQLIKCWQMSDQPERSLNLLHFACTIYTTRGFYEDALVYGEQCLKLLEQHYPNELSQRLDLYMKMFNCYAGLNMSLEGLRIAEAALSLTDDPNYVFPWCYIMAILYSRYLPERDLAKAEAYLERGLQELAKADLPKHTRFFQTAFNRNGLALVRHFQKRPQEAIELCQASFDKLNEELGPNEHLLHRSVLLYNIAQVYAQTGPYDEALKYFTATMAIDPNYSEYYNERGNVYLKIGRLEDAVHDYMRAIDLSPPYMEVWTNLGQCYSLMERFEDAIDAYSRAIDLDPNHTLSLVGRAQAFEAVGHSEDAFSDYSAALQLNPKQASVLANRAVLHYEAGRMLEALADLDQAIALAPEMADLYQNRSVALTELGRIDDAIQDLETYLRLHPDAEDRPDVEQRMVDLRAGSVVA